MARSVVVLISCKQTSSQSVLADELLRLLEEITADVLDDEILEGAELAEDSELVAEGSELDETAELLDAPFPENWCNCHDVLLPAAATMIVKETFTMSPAARPVMS